MTPSVKSLVNDPFLKLRGPGLTFSKTSPNPSLSHQIDVFYMPDLEKADWTPLTTQLVEENSVSPDISKMRYHINYQTEWKLFYFQDSKRRMDLFLQGGIGLIQTVDDLTALQKEDDPQAQSTEVQLHPTLNIGISTQISNVYTDQNIVFACKNVRYIETIDGTTLEMKSNLICSIGKTFVFGGM